MGKALDTQHEDSSLVHQNPHGHRIRCLESSHCCDEMRGRQTNPWKHTGQLACYAWNSKRSCLKNI